MPVDPFCIPGQGQQVADRWVGIPAVAPYFVAVVTVSGDFDPSSGNVQRKVELIGSESGDTGTELTPERWEKKVIVVPLPATNPSPGATTFSMKVTTRDGTTYRATPVKVTSIGGTGGYPPCHHPITGDIVPALAPINA